MMEKSWVMMIMHQTEGTRMLVPQMRCSMPKRAGCTGGWRRVASVDNRVDLKLCTVMR